MSLHRACIRGKYNNAKKLLKAGENPNGIVGENSHLLVAINSNNVNMVRLLIEHGADVNLSAPYYPIFMACQRGYSKIVDILLENGADVNVSNGAISVIMIACMYSDSDTVTKILRKNPDLTVCDDVKWTPLMFACRYQCDEISEMMIDGSDVNAKNIEGCSVFSISCRKRSIVFINKLLEAGAIVDSIDIDNAIRLCENHHVRKILTDVKRESENDPSSLTQNLKKKIENLPDIVDVERSRNTVILRLVRSNPTSQTN